MNAKQIKAVKVGDRVKFEPLEHDAGDYCEGTITHKHGERVEITWDDGETCTMIPHDYTRVFLVQP
jgi:hypothetical protein